MEVVSTSSSGASARLGQLYRTRIPDRLWGGEFCFIGGYLKESKMGVSARTPVEVWKDLNKPTNVARALPGGWYTDADYAHLESIQLFARSWVCAGFAHELKAIGDVVPVQVADYPVLLLRSEDGISAFHNICPHRGFKLVDSPQNGKGIIRCPYHHWAFDTMGRLRSTPHWGGYKQHQLPHFDPDCHGLKPIRCAQWHDWVFVNIDGSALPLDEYMHPFVNHLAEYDLSLVRHHRTVPFEIKGNWKIVEENFLEVLHLPPVHVRLSEYAPFHEHVIVSDAHCVGTVIDTGLPSSWASEPLPRFPGVPRSSQTAKNLALFPNLKIIVGPDHCCSMVELPSNVNLTNQRWDFYFVGETSLEDRYHEARDGIIDFFVETNEEDAFAVEGLHLGRLSPNYDGGVLSEVWEGGVHHFQKLVAQYMANQT